MVGRVPHMVLQPWGGGTCTRLPWRAKFKFHIRGTRDKAHYQVALGTEESFVSASLA